MKPIRNVSIARAVSFALLMGGGAALNAVQAQSTSQAASSSEQDRELLETITVEAERARTVYTGISTTGTKSTTPLNETPQAITVITSDWMEMQNIQNVEDALRYAAGVKTSPYGNDPRNDTFFIRGFNQTTSGLYRDGLTTPNGQYGNWRSEPFALERVEVLRGPSSMLYGANSPGGLVNQMSKRPTAKPVANFQVEYGSFESKQAGFDATGSNLSVEWTAGGMVSTPSDIARLALALRDARIVSPASLKFMTDWTPAWKDAEVGHGLFRTRTAAGTVIGHNGSELGFTGSFYWTEHGDAVIAVGSNVGTMHSGEFPASAPHVAHKSDFATLAVRFAGQHAAPAIGANVEATYKSLVANEGVVQALDFIKKNDAQTLREQIEIAEIPAPPFKEQVRARDFQARLQKLGLQTTLDSEGNVIATRKGSGQGGTLVLSAHLDTVFPEGTDVTVRKQGERYYGRGFADDTRGLVAVLSVLRAMQDANIRTRGDVMFVGTVGEEGLGNPHCPPPGARRRRWKC